jgi:DNA-binding transcriptional MocR family regulator
MTESQLKHEMPPFAMVPRWIIRNEELTAGAVRVYACLADMAGRDRPAWPSHRTLAQYCNMSVSSVRRHIAELIEARAIDVKQRYKPDGAGQISNLYTVLVIPNVNKVVDDKTEGVTENNPIPTSEHPPYSSEDNEQNQENKNHYALAHEHIRKARELLK